VVFCRPGGLRLGTAALPFSYRRPTRSRLLRENERRDDESRLKLDTAPVEPPNGHQQVDKRGLELPPPRGRNVADVGHVSPLVTRNEPPLTLRERASPRRRYTVGIAPKWLQTRHRRNWAPSLSWPLQCRSDLAAAHPRFLQVLHNGILPIFGQSGKKYLGPP